MQSCGINERVESIKKNMDEINKLVEEYKPFIASCTEKSIGHYVRYGEDDELTIAMMAFVEAIHAYSSKRGSFLSFAQGVIKRRLIDYYRKEKKHQKVIPLFEQTQEDDEEKDLSIDESIGQYTLQVESENRRLEIEELKSELSRWGISFQELVEASPKHARTKRDYQQMIEFVLTQPEMIHSIKKKKYLPIAEIEKSLRVSRKKIERARKYIIAVMIIKTGDYHYLKEYLL